MVLLLAHGESVRAAPAHASGTTQQTMSSPLNAEADDSQARRSRATTTTTPPLPPTRTTRTAPQRRHHTALSTGVYPARSGRFEAMISVRGAYKYLGAHDTPKHASVAFEWAARLRDACELEMDTPVPAFPGQVTAERTEASPDSSLGGLVTKPED